MTLISKNPATNEVLKEHVEWSPRDVTLALDRTWQAWQGWRETSHSVRSTMTRALADVLDRRKAELGRIITLEVGKPIREAIGEVEKCALCCRYYAEHGAGFLEPEHVKTDGRGSYVRFDPLGIVLAVMPWNFPLWQVFRAAVPALFAGNALALKHASNAMWSAASIEGLFVEAGFPRDLLVALQISSGGVEQVIADPRVRGVTLTGSVTAGRKVAALAGRYLKKTVLELGGSDPFMVLEDADLERAAATAAKARTINAGQSCIAAKRFIAVEPVYDRFLALFTEHMAALKVGDPLDPDTDIGAMAKEEFLLQLDEQVKSSVNKGARLVLGGERVNRPGSFYPPSILADAMPGMPCWDEEMFGPVATVIRATDEEHAVRIANGGSFGLGGSVWTRNLERGERVAAKTESGAVFVNGMVKSDPRLPFGGVKDSGYGRELGVYGIREFVNIKTVWVGD